MTWRCGIAVFPGTWSERDCAHWVELAGGDPVMLWHAEPELKGADVVILPGGFAHGDYLRTGAIARFAPLMAAVREHALAGGPVLGICNGFQILCEAQLLPGALLRNSCLQFRCQTTHLRVEVSRGPFLSGLEAGEVLQMPISHGEGRYYAPPEQLRELEAGGQVALRYCGPSGDLGDQHNPNGSLRHIAGVMNAEGNVLGMMPHPERACEPLLGSEDGLQLLRAALAVLAPR